MWAYIDESGNTGARVFDKDQPLFITVGMMTKANFDMVYGSEVDALARELGVGALHANELGVTKLERIAKRLARMLKRSDARFFVSRLEKSYLAATKVVDTYFDQGLNPAVPWGTYWLRPMRLLLTFKLAHYLLTEETAQKVWECLNATNEQKAGALFVEAGREMLGRVGNVPDDRSRTIFTDSLTWAIENPSAFDFYSKSKTDRYFHSPNFPAFTGLMDGIEAQSKGWRRPVREIIHDEQSQFKKTFMKWHDLYSRPELASVAPLKWPGEAKPYTLSRVAGSVFRMTTEEQSEGLQVVDVVMWLFKRWADGKDLGPETGRLLGRVLQRAHQIDFSFKGVGESTERKMEEVFSTPITEEHAAAAHEMLARQEENRQKAMADYAATETGRLASTQSVHECR